MSIVNHADVGHTFSGVVDSSIQTSIDFELKPGDLNSSLQLNIISP
jgi:hypothetical protein